MKRLWQSSKNGLCVAALGLVLMIWGIFRGEMPVVLEKAIHICMECIGIG
ncbi:MAG: thioredoxin [Lachnospiraceae bacterium]|jgi:hypothetical protein|nr:thioredoxin [Lachnospiraceae bacterium]